MTETSGLTEMRGERGGEESPPNGAGIPVSENMAVLSCPSAACEVPCLSRYVPCIVCEGHHMDQEYSVRRKSDGDKVLRTDHNLLSFPVLPGEGDIIRSKYN